MGKNSSQVSPQKKSFRSVGKAPAYIVWQSCGYCFRFKVPDELHQIVGRKEIRYSLRTGFLSEAKLRARRMAAFIQTLFRNMSEGGRMRELSEIEIKRLVENCFRDMLDRMEYARVMQKRPMDDEELVNYRLILDTEWENAREQLIYCNYRESRNTVDLLLEDHGIEIDKDSFSYRKLCRELLKTWVRALEVEQRWTRGDYSADELSIQGVGGGEPEEPSETLATLIQLYVAEQDKAGNWTPKSKEEISACLNLLTEFFGDVPVKSITRTQMSGFKQALMRLPANMRKVRVYRDKSIHEILKMDVASPMAANTLNKYLSSASTLFKYALQHGLMDINPAEGLTVKSSKRADEYRDVFSEADLEKLFRSSQYLEDTHRSGYAFWLPILALYTGCRLEELAQLHLDDIRMQDDVWVLDINSEGEKKVKSRAGIRLVPLHSFLVDDLKFAQYAGKLREQGHGRLFPELTRGRDGFGMIPSKWFARYKRQCGMVEGARKKDFHSFRHTFINALKQDRTVDNVMISELVGHEVESITMGRYGKRYSPKVLLEQVISKLRFDVDLAHLKESRLLKGL
jgi:integrase